jgi:hypothetical protein
VERLTEAAFIRGHVLPRLDAIPGDVRNRAMRRALANLAALSAVDRGIADALMRAPFVPTASGTAYQILLAT